MINIWYISQITSPMADSGGMAHIAPNVAGLAKKPREKCSDSLRRVFHVGKVL